MHSRESRDYCILYAYYCTFHQVHISLFSVKSYNLKDDDRPLRDKNQSKNLEISRVKSIESHTVLRIREKKSVLQV